MVLCVQEEALDLVHGVVCTGGSGHVVHGAVRTGGSSSAWCCVYRR